VMTCFVELLANAETLKTKLTECVSIHSES
jgi:hypothetical protein